MNEKKMLHSGRNSGNTGGWSSVSLQPPEEKRVQLGSAGQRNLPDLKGKFRPVAGSSGKSVTS